MTLLIGLANKDLAVLAADRRVTSNGELVDDEFTKLCVLFCDDARMAIAFTGLATIGEFNTANWLVEALSDIGRTHRGLSDILSQLRHRADETFSKFPAAHRRLCLMFVGFLHSGSAPQAAVYLLKNFQEWSGGTSEFILSNPSASQSPIVEVAGATAGFSASARSTLAQVVRSRTTGPNVVRAAIGAVQRASRHERSRGLVGLQCNTAVLSSQPDSRVVATYHSAHVTGRAYGANVVIAGDSCAKGIMMETAQALAGPEIRKKDPCWCGSGKIFKNCHLKTFGSIYVNLPGWKCPSMTGIFMVVLNEARPSGHIFCVANAFT